MRKYHGLDIRLLSILSIVDIVDFNRQQCVVRECVCVMKLKKGLFRGYSIEIDCLTAACLRAHK